MYVAVNGTPQRVPQHGQILEEDLLLEVLGARRDEHALAAEDGGNEIGERLAGAGAGFGEQHAAVGEDVGDGRGHLELGRTRLEPVERRRQRTARSENRGDGVLQRGRRRAGAAHASGYSGNVRHRSSTSVLTAAERGVVVGRRERPAR